MKLILGIIIFLVILVTCSSNGEVVTQTFDNRVISKDYIIHNKLFNVNCTFIPFTCKSATNNQVIEYLEKNNLR